MSEQPATETGGYRDGYYDCDVPKGRVAELESELRRLRALFENSEQHAQRYAENRNKWQALADELAKVLTDILFIWLNPTTTRSIEETDALATRGNDLIAKHAEMKGAHPMPDSVLDQLIRLAEGRRDG